jgi:ribosomal protein RSM22 (predicted rRNA methylase)
MVKTKSRQFDFPSFLENQIEQHLKSIGLSLLDDKKLASYIQQMSDYYIEHPDKTTPWSQKWAQAAQVAYYLPLNYLRCQAVVDEAKRVRFFDDIKSFCEIGSGLGALTSHLSENISNGYCVEISNEANQLHQKLFPKQKHGYKNDALSAPVDLVAFSYVLTELSNIPSSALNAEALLIIEPSTQDDGRKLMSLRQKLIDKGFYIWGPCTHQGKCPLLTHSKKDWCHDRIHLQMPEWFLNIEKHLKFKNRTVTYSYLLARKTAPPAIKASSARSVGDMLEEKGKSKVMICRGEEREFLSWLHKDKMDIEIHRGELLNLDFPTETKGSELRIKK